MNFFKRIALSLCLAAGSLLSANAIGWPANYEGVMLQGFYWDSYTSETKWNKLEQLADEYSQYFSLIWVPNSAKSSGGLGYLPVYWFTNHNSAMGTEQQLRSMIKTYKSKGVGIIADVVINHRVGVSNWTNFPRETWNGVTYQIGADGICSDDEVAGQSGQTQPTGARDTGEGYAAGRDLDHTNANVQENCKAYTKCLLDEYGYAGFRYDYCKGYSGQYNKIYNQYSKPTYSVGEYWDGSYDALKTWIESTGKESAAFDFAFKYAVNNAFSYNDMTKLVWKANGTTDQPAGLIHYGYAQLAVTFIDNHDTYRDGNKFNGNVVAANAFMLCSPGTPCVFLPHYNANKSAIQQLIKVRNSVGVNNMSAVKVLQSSRDCYMAEVTGTKGTLVVKIGSAMASPSGYSDADIKASGNGYCVWTKVGVSPNPNPDPDPDPDPHPDGVTVYWDNSTAKWATPYIHYWGGAESTWPGVAMSLHDGDVWVYKCPTGTTGCLFNAGNGDATKTADFVAVDGHIYNQSGDQGVYGNGPTPDPGKYPATLYMIGNVNGGAWGTTDDVAVAAKGNEGVYTYDVTIDDAGAGSGYFAFITVTGSDWDSEVNTGDRYGAPAKDTPVTLGTPQVIALYAAGVNASASESWMIAPGRYSVKVDLKSMQLTVGNSGVESVEADADAPVEYFNLQGIRIDQPVRGNTYIRRQGTSVTKILVL